VDYIPVNIAKEKIKFVADELGIDEQDLLLNDLL
jgi:hypothetical protein